MEKIYCVFKRHNTHSAEYSILDCWTTPEKAFSSAIVYHTEYIAELREEKLQAVKDKYLNLARFIQQEIDETTIDTSTIFNNNSFKNKLLPVYGVIEKEVN